MTLCKIIFGKSDLQIDLDLEQKVLSRSKFDIHVFKRTTLENTTLLFVALNEKKKKAQNVNKVNEITKKMKNHS